MNPGETWKVTVDARTYSVEGGTILSLDEFGEVDDTLDTIADMVAALADQINADNWSAVIDIAGGTVATGEIWTLTIDSTIYTFTVGATPETLEEIAAALAEAVNSDATDATPTDYKAEVVGTELRIGAFSDSFVVVSLSDDVGSYTPLIPFNYSAIAKGDMLIVINRAGPLGTPTFMVLPSGSGFVDTSTPAGIPTTVAG